MRRLIGLLLTALVVLTIGYALISSGPRVPDGSVLVIELAGPLAEAPPMDALARFVARGPALPTLLLQLEKAGADERIAAVLLHIRPLAVGIARLQELRGAIARLRDAGKPVIALLDLESFNATRELYLASAASQVYVAPAFLGPLAGIAAQYLHLGGFLDKLGIDVEYERAGEYKSAPEMFAARELSAPAREQANALLDGLYAQIVSGIAAGRALEPQRVRELVEAVPRTTEDYLREGLADGIADRAEVLERAGFAEAEEIDVSTYLYVDPQDLELRNGPAIALIFAEGTIVPGRGGRSLRSSGFAADRIAEALEAAAEDEEIEAIVLRMNSGGGSQGASDQLWRVIRRARERKPVVISMSDAAASGGYYVASAADAIVAEPATLTGSIGVFVLRPSLAGLYRKLDIGAEVLSRGPFAGVTGSDEPLTPGQREQLRDIVHAFYREFLDRVATGRDISAEKVDRLGRGRVWLGESAAANGLVDQVGGLHTAIALAKEEADIAADVDPRRIVFPGPRSLTEQLQEFTRGWFGAWLMGDLLPGPLPDTLRGALLALDGELVYLPTYWLELLP